MTTERPETEKPAANETAAEKSAAPFSRREFARRAAIASVVASVAPAGVMGGEIASRVAATPARTLPAAPVVAFAQDVLPANQNSSAANAPKLSAESQTEADARFQAIVAQYGGRFSDEQKADLRRLCTFAQPSLERLRAYKVENGDGAGLYPQPLFEREKKPKPPAGAKTSAPAAPQASSAATKP
jgi:hypothetical protein